MNQAYDIGRDYLQREADQNRFVQEMKSAKISDVTIKEIGNIAESSR